MRTGADEPVSVPRVYRRWEIRQQHLHVLLPADVTANSMERQILFKIKIFIYVADGE